MKILIVSLLLVFSNLPNTFVRASTSSSTTSDLLKNLSDDELVHTIKSNDFLIVLFCKFVHHFVCLYDFYKLKKIFSQQRKTVIFATNSRHSC